MVQPSDDKNICDNKVTISLILLSFLTNNSLTVKFLPLRSQKFPQFQGLCLEIPLVLFCQTVQIHIAIGDTYLLVSNTVSSVKYRHT